MDASSTGMRAGVPDLLDSVSAATIAVMSEASVIGHAAHRLARHKVPIRVLTVDAFSVTASANGTKIQKARLRELAMERLALA